MADDVDAFSSQLSQLRHVLRAPVAQIIGYAEMMIEDLSGDIEPEMVRDLQAIASSGERLVAMIEEHLGPAKRSAEELNLPEAQFQLRLQLNHISGYTEMLREVGEEEDLDEIVDDLDRIAGAERRLVALLETQLQEQSFEADTAMTPEPDTDPSLRAASLQLDVLAQGGRLLVVDTDETNRDLLQRRMTKLGFEIGTAAGGEAALQAVQTQEFDLVLMELMMDGVSGLEVLRRLKDDPATRELPVIMLSTVDDLDQMVECVLAGADDYLISPIRPILLQARIGASLEKIRLRRRFTRQLRVFISSPGDVIPERRIVKQAIQQLDDEYGREVQLVPVLWEEEPLVASETFQTQIVEPRDTDIYLAILWSRIGSPVPKTIVRPDGTQYESGTAYEFEDAMSSFRETGSPQMLMYRKTGAPMVDLTDREAVMDRLEQLESLDRYIDRWFRGPDGSFLGAFHEFSEPEQFESMLSVHLRKLIDRWLEEHDTDEPR
ncbi:MAG: response regulator [Acidimicrobiales bacterium]